MKLLFLVSLLFLITSCALNRMMLQPQLKTLSADKVYVISSLEEKDDRGSCSLMRKRQCSIALAFNEGELEKVFSATGGQLLKPEQVPPALNVPHVQKAEFENCDPKFTPGQIAWGTGSAVTLGILPFWANYARCLNVTAKLPDGTAKEFTIKRSGTFYFSIAFFMWGPFLGSTPEKDILINMISEIPLALKNASGS